MDGAGRNVRGNAAQLPLAPFWLQWVPDAMTFYLEWAPQLHAMESRVRAKVNASESDPIWQEAKDLVRNAANHTVQNARTMALCRKGPMDEYAAEACASDRNGLRRERLLRPLEHEGAGARHLLGPPQGAGGPGLAQRPVAALPPGPRRLRHRLLPGMPWTLRPCVTGLRGGAPPPRPLSGAFRVQQGLAHLPPQRACAHAAGILTVGAPHEE
eukprot:CAMPEP_0175342766 /NCGR_PEP_ID=MMETSP0095-20121207/7009_1 /TAXON_ID=311494 /ORGANISM="Alexandrium monilatum, Strain CCMP3105" /LENGTH=212 /DNA_ID=CAMNT_0016640189 /DNA_START=147 /DNA_END=782 /DNA_ORIENTATION=-